MEFDSGRSVPEVKDIFPNMDIAPKFTESSHQLLGTKRLERLDFCSVNGKTLYELCVKMLNKEKLKVRVETPWAAHFGVENDCKPVWRNMYKPPLTKANGDLQWRILHGIVAVNAFVSIINPAVDSKCPFCNQRGTIFHCFVHCDRLKNLFLMLNFMFVDFKVIFSKVGFIFGFKFWEKKEEKRATC